jgi:hypothetical protein
VLECTSDAGPLALDPIFGDRRRPCWTAGFRAGPHGVDPKVSVWSCSSLWWAIRRLVELVPECTSQLGSVVLTRTGLHAPRSVTPLACASLVMWSLLSGVDPCGLAIGGTLGLNLGAHATKSKR